MQSRVRAPRGSRLRRRVKVKLSHSESFTVDIGAGGFCTELLRVLPPGTTIEGSFQMSGRDVPFTGSVVWVKAGDPYMGLRGRMGVHFTRPPTGLDELMARPGTPARGVF